MIQNLNKLQYKYFIGRIQGKNDLVPGKLVQDPEINVQNPAGENLGPGLEKGKIFIIDFII